MDVVAVSVGNRRDFGLAYDYFRYMAGELHMAGELPTSLQTLTLTSEHLAKAYTLSEMQLPAGSLVIMIRRGNRYIVPNGHRRLPPADTLLIIKEDESGV